jgi:hypothetical protein
MVPFPKLKARSLINEKAHAADQAADFSQRIREGLPRPPRRSADLSVPGLHVSQPGPRVRYPANRAPLTGRAAN